MRKGRPNKPNVRKDRTEKAIELLEILDRCVWSVLLIASVTVTRIGVFFLVGW